MTGDTNILTIEHNELHLFTPRLKLSDSDSEVQLRLGVALYHGLGVKKNLFQAMQHFQIAMDKAQDQIRVVVLKWVFKYFSSFYDRQEGQQPWIIDKAQMEFKRCQPDELNLCNRGIDIDENRMKD